MTLVQTEPKKIYLWNNELKAVYLWENKVRPVTPPYLCFTAEEANSTVYMERFWTNMGVVLEVSTDWVTWVDYDMTLNPNQDYNWATITCAKVWDKVYWRSKSMTETTFSASSSRFHRFQTTWKFAVSWDVTTLLCKYGTKTLEYSGTSTFYYLFNGADITTPPKLPATTLTNSCYREMFTWASITTVPELPATTLENYCYNHMFYGCKSLTSITRLPATTLKSYCYQYMFWNCTNIKLSTTQTWDYQTAYRIPTEWTGTTASSALSYMFQNTWWTFKWSPSINTTYYTSNTVI